MDWDEYIKWGKEAVVWGSEPEKIFVIILLDPKINRAKHLIQYHQILLKIQVHRTNFEVFKIILV